MGSVQILSFTQNLICLRTSVCTKYFTADLLVSAPNISWKSGLQAFAECQFPTSILLTLTLCLSGCMSALNNLP